MTTTKPRETPGAARAIALIFVALAALVIGACSRPSDPSVAYPGGACGVRVFRAPACEQLIDYQCCTQKIGCSEDASCSRMAACMLGCKGRGEACSQSCVFREAPSPATQAGLQKLQSIFACAGHSGRGPNNLTCGDDS